MHGNHCHAQMFGSEIIPGKENEKKKEEKTEVDIVRFHDFGIKYIVSNGWWTSLSDLAI